MEQRITIAKKKKIEQGRESVTRCRKCHTARRKEVGIDVLLCEMSGELRRGMTVNERGREGECQRPIVWGRERDHHSYACTPVEVRKLIFHVFE